MVDAVGHVMSGVGVGAVRTTHAPSREQETGPKAGEASGLTAALPSLSPLMRSDPVSGVLITQYLSSDGQVRMQIPSEVAVAYLRSGLTETGVPSPAQKSSGQAEGEGPNVIA